MPATPAPSRTPSRSVATAERCCPAAALLLAVVAPSAAAVLARITGPLARVPRPVPAQRSAA